MNKNSLLLFSIQKLHKILIENHTRFSGKESLSLCTYLTAFILGCTRIKFHQKNRLSLNSYTIIFWICKNILVWKDNFSIFLNLKYYKVHKIVMYPTVQYHIILSEIEAVTLYPLNIPWKVNFTNLSRY